MNSDLISKKRNKDNNDNISIDIRGNDFKTCLNSVLTQCKANTSYFGCNYTSFVL